MKIAHALCLAAAAAALAVSPALAGWKLVPHGVAEMVVKGPLTITPGDDWNRSTSHLIAKAEVWTLDGQELNNLYLVSGLSAGETLYKDAKKKDKPLPAMDAKMQLTDIPDFVESSMSVALDTSSFEVTKVEPASLGGHSAVKFTYQYVVAASPLIHKGIAIGTIAGQQLYVINFTAPALYYFDRDAPGVVALMDSAKL